MVAYSTDPKTGEFQRVEFDKFWDQNIIEPAQAGSAALIVFASKKDGVLRFCVEYHRLNVKTKWDAYLIPFFTKNIDSLGEATTFLTLKTDSGH